jgi:hypothetical protein
MTIMVVGGAVFAFLFLAAAMTGIEGSEHR